MIDVYLSETRDKKAATRFFKQCLQTTGVTPSQITTDKEPGFSDAIKTAYGTSTVHLTVVGMRVIRRIEQQAQIRAVANVIACDIHPLNNLSVLQYLKNEWQVSGDQKTAWYHHWLKVGFDAVEKMLTRQGDYCFDHQITLADICLVPQVYNAHRFEFDMQAYPRICAINEACSATAEFADAAP